MPGWVMLTGKPGPVGRLRAAVGSDRLRATVGSDWLIKVVRLTPAPVPWAQMLRGALAVCGPLAAGLTLDKPLLGTFAAMGGLLVTVVDRDGPYPVRIGRIAVCAVAGGAAGITVGHLIHGLGWVTVAVLVAVAGVSAVLGAVGSTASLVGLQLLIFTVLGTGPLGAVRPWWYPPALLMAGAAWATVLLIPGWLFFPHAALQRSVAAVYRALAGLLRAVGTEHFADARRGGTTALNAAYDQLLARRARSAGKDEHLVRLAALLNQAHPVAEAVITLAHEGHKPPAAAAETIDAIADSIRYRTAAPGLPPLTDATAGVRALRDAVAGVLELLAGKRSPPYQGRPAAPHRREWLDKVFGEIVGGRLTRQFAVRLMACVGVAAIISEALAIRRSYWVVLTVVIVLKPDFGSVFARALQRGIGTIIGAVAGALILAVVPYGPLLLVPCAVFAALLPFGRSRNYGLFSIFQTPLVVILIDLLTRTGWQLAVTRLTDTLLGCGIVLLIGYAPWPMSWQAHLPGQFSTAVEKVARYAQSALGDGSPASSRLRRQAYRALSDLRTEFQRTMAEPHAVSGRAALWWPAIIALEHLMDKVTATAVQAGQGAARPSQDGVRQVTDALDAIARAARSGARPPALPPPDEESLRPVADAVRGVQRALTGAPSLAR